MSHAGAGVTSDAVHAAHTILLTASYQTSHRDCCYPTTELPTTTFRECHWPSSWRLLLSWMNCSITEAEPDRDVDTGVSRSTVKGSSHSILWIAASVAWPPLSRAVVLSLELHAEESASLACRSATSRSEVKWNSLLLLEFGLKPVLPAIYLSCDVFLSFKDAGMVILDRSGRDTSAFRTWISGFFSLLDSAGEGI